MSYLELELNSRDRESYSNSSADYVREFKQPIQNIKGIQLLRSVIPRTTYNIAESLSNNILDFQYSGATYSVTIPDGAYDETSLTGQLQSLMSGATSTTIYVSYGSSTATAGATFKVSFLHPLYLLTTSSYSLVLALMQPLRPGMN